MDEIWKHTKTGGLYKILGQCVIEETLDAAVRYQNIQGDGPEWIRPKREFMDGRFEIVKPRKED